VHHAARRDRQVAAHFEGVGGHHRRHPGRRGQVGGERPQAADGALAAGVDQGLPGGRAEQRVIARRGRGDQVGEQELQPRVVAPAEFGPGHQGLGRLGRRQVGLDAAPQDRVAGPGRVGEPAVARACAHFRRDRGPAGRDPA